VLDLCQSDLEREFGRCLLDLGYRIRSQVPVGGYSIDFVIEGDDDRRLAIELDGDKYHGPDRWADDIRRQRTLERLGWVFWRCWGSAWNSDRDGCVSDLQGTLERLGIGPLGMAEAGGVYTQHVEIEPPAPTAPTIAEVAQVAEMVSHATPLVPDSEFGAPSLLGNTIDLSQTLRPPASANGGEAPTISADFAGNSIAVGDLVIVRYNDQPERPVTIRLSEEVNRPSDGVVHVSEPLAAAILGGSVDDVVEIEVAGRQRTAVIEKIEKAREVTPATGQPFRPI
jgi:very-short-patch-repair endonuclease